MKTNTQSSCHRTSAQNCDEQLQSAIMDQLLWLLWHDEGMSNTRLCSSIRLPADERESPDRRSAKGRSKQSAKAKGDKRRQRQKQQANTVAEFIEPLIRQGICRISATGARRIVRLIAEADPKLWAMQRAMQAAFDNGLRAGLRFLASDRQHTVAELECVIRQQVVGAWHELASDLICRDVLADIATLTGYATEGKGKNRLIRLPETCPPAAGAPAGQPPVRRRLPVRQVYMMDALLLELGHCHRNTEDFCDSMHHYLRPETGAAAFCHWCKTHPCAVARDRLYGGLEYWAMKGLFKEAFRILKRRGDITECRRGAGPYVRLDLTRSADIADRFCDLHRMVSLAHAAAADVLVRGARLTEAQLRDAMRAALPARKGVAMLDAVITHVLHRLETSGKYATEEDYGGRVFWLEDAPRRPGRRRRASAR
jgi:hypothetical protein